MLHLVIRKVVCRYIVYAYSICQLPPPVFMQIVVIDRFLVQSNHLVDTSLRRFSNLCKMTSNRGIVREHNLRHGNREKIMEFQKIFAKLGNLFFLVEEIGTLYFVALD